MSDFEEKIAKVTSSFIGFEDHGLLSVSLTFDYGGSSQGIGHRAFGSSSEETDEADKWRLAHEMGMDFVRRLMLACGVETWESIKGRTVLVTCSWTEITRIAPLPTERGVPFDISDWVESYAPLKAQEATR